MLTHFILKDESWYPSQLRSTLLYNWKNLLTETLNVCVSPLNTSIYQSSFLCIQEGAIQAKKHKIIKYHLCDIL